MSLYSGDYTLIGAFVSYKELQDIIGIFMAKVLVLIIGNLNCEDLNNTSMDISSHLATTNVHHHGYFHEYFLDSFHETFLECFLEYFHEYFHGSCHGFSYHVLYQGLR